jgi:hypothetical protein
MRPTSITPIPPGPYILPPSSGDTRGVDYLGLRQVNLALTAACFPGINNVARFVRPFSVLAWIHWKFHQQARAENWTKASERQLRKFQEKVEVLFTWGHQLKPPKAVSIPGSDAKIPPADAQGYIDLSFGTWKRIARNTSLQAPVQYGPAMKIGSGLGFLNAQGSGLHRCFPAGFALAQALDARLADTTAYDLVCSLDQTTGRAADAEALLSAWHAAKPSDAEAEIFKSAFYQPGALGTSGVLGQRSTMIAAILTVLGTAKAPIAEEQIRRSLVWQHLPDGRPVPFSPACAVPAARWKILQIRQVQRIALEAILQWFEHTLQAEPSLPKIREQLAAAFTDDKRSDGGAISCAEAMARFAHGIGSEADYRARCAVGHDDDLLAQGLVLYKTTKVSGTKLVAAAWLLVGIARWTNWIAEDAEQRADLRRGDVDRISLWHLQECLHRAAGKTLVAWIQDVLDRWIIGQHLRVATLRSDGGAQRLRFGLGEEGLEFYANRPSKPVLTQDHLAAALSLMDNCGLIARDPASATFTLL